MYILHVFFFFYIGSNTCFSNIYSVIRVVTLFPSFLRSSTASDPPGRFFVNILGRRSSCILSTWAAHHLLLTWTKSTMSWRPLICLRCSLRMLTYSVFEWMALTIILISVVRRSCFVTVVSGLDTAPFVIIGCTQVLYMWILLLADINLFFQTRLDDYKGFYWIFNLREGRAFGKVMWIARFVYFQLQILNRFFLMITTRDYFKRVETRVGQVETGQRIRL